MSILTSSSPAAAAAAAASADELQIWDNAAFDLDPSKENQNPQLLLPSPATLDAEIAAIESQIAGLSKQLHSLRLKRSQIEKQSKNPLNSKFLNLQTPPRPHHRRGLSLGGPADILHLRNTTTTTPKNRILRRGMSIGPSEIYRQTMMTGTTVKPVGSKFSELRKGFATVGPKVNSVRKESDGLKPKNLFSEEMKKKPKGRVVASRYSLPSNNNGSLNVNVNTRRGGDDGSMMKRRKWSPPSIGKIGEGLPKIKIVRGMESPRDSGRAKKVAELVGKRPSPFLFDEGSVSSCSSDSFSCQRLSFED